MIEFLTILFIVIGIAAFVFPLILCIIYVPESNKSTTIIIYLLIGSILMLGYIDKASRIIAREQAIMDQKKAEEQYQFEKSAAPTVNPARIGKDVEETIKLVKELFSRFKDSKEVSKELETIAKNLESKKPLDTKEITFLRNKAIEKGLVVRPSYVRQTLKFPDTVGDETRQLFGDVVRRGGKTTLIDSAAEAYRRGDLEVINGVVEPDAFGGFTIRKIPGKRGDLIINDKSTGVSYGVGAKTFQRSEISSENSTPTTAPSAGAATAEEALAQKMLNNTPPSDAYKTMESRINTAFDEVRNESDIDIATNYAESSILTSKLSDAEAAKLREHIQSVKEDKLEKLKKPTTPEQSADQPKASEPVAEPEPVSKQTPEDVSAAQKNEIREGIQQSMLDDIQRGLSGQIQNTTDDISAQIARRVRDRAKNKLDRKKPVTPELTPPEPQADVNAATRSGATNIPKPKGPDQLIKEKYRSEFEELRSLNDPEKIRAKAQDMYSRINAEYNNAPKENQPSAGGIWDLYNELADIARKKGVESYFTNGMHFEVKSKKKY